MGVMTREYRTQMKPVAASAVKQGGNDAEEDGHEETIMCPVQHLRKTEREPTTYLGSERR